MCDIKIFIFAIQLKTILLFLTAIPLCLCHVSPAAHIKSLQTVELRQLFLALHALRM